MASDRDEATGERELEQIRQLALAEYQSLRQESEQARTAQQTILNWTFGALAVLLGAGISQVGRDPISAEVVLLFGIGLPAFLTAAALIWIGELARMERAGFFLRRWERENWVSHPSSGELVGPIWENYLSFDPANSFGKHWASYLGGAALYGGGVILSLVLFHTTEPSAENVGNWLDAVIGNPGWTTAIVFFVFLVLCLVAGLPVARRGSKMPPPRSLRPKSYPER